MTADANPALDIGPYPPLVVMRLLPAPRALAFRAWTDPKQLAKWWGPKTWTNPVVEAAAQAGGRLHIRMRGPEGLGELPMDGRFHEVEPPGRLVLGTWLQDAQGRFLENRATVVFEEEGPDATRMTLTVELLLAKERSRPMVRGMAAGWNQSLDKLEGLLAGGVEPFCTGRAFHAPVSLLWEAHTQPEHLSRWMAPAGSTVFHSDMDFREGGSYHYGLRTAEGVEMWGLQRYLRIEPGVRLSSIQSFSNKDRGPARHPLSPSWPLETLTHVDFFDLGNGMAAVSVSWAPYRSDAAGVAAFDGGRAGMKGGFKGTLDSLEAYLSGLLLSGKGGKASPAG